VATIDEATQLLADRHKGDVILGVEGAAKMLGAHPNSIRRWANSGRLRCFLDCNGWRKFKMQDVLRFKNELERLV
jgi:predicted site-specific integrase-resolvase